MAEKQTKSITINDKEYTEDQLNDQQKVMINHIADLDRKIGSTQFNLDQLQVGKSAFMEMLTKTLEEPPPSLKFILATTEVKKIPITILSRLSFTTVVILFDNFAYGSLAGLKESSTYLGSLSFFN